MPQVCDKCLILFISKPNPYPTIKAQHLMLKLVHNSTINTKERTPIIMFNVYSLFKSKHSDCAFHTSEKYANFRFSKSQQHS